MNTYLITGSAGFIGSHFVRFILERDQEAQVVSLDALTYAGSLKNLEDADKTGRHSFVQADICDAETLRKTIANYKPDFVVNFAAESHVDRSFEQPDKFFQTNTEGVSTLLQVLTEAWEGQNFSQAQGNTLLGQVSCDTPEQTLRNTHRFVHISTDEVYGPHSSAAGAAPTLFTENAPLRPTTPYAQSKAEADRRIAEWIRSCQARGYQFPVFVVRSTNNYGTHQYPEKLIPLTVQKALSHETITLYGDGTQKRSWLYVEDNCRAIYAVLKEGRIGEVYNVSDNNEYSNLELVQTILKMLAELTGDKHINADLIQFVPGRPIHDHAYGIDTSKITHELNWEPEADFEERLFSTLAWYVSDWQRDSA